MATGNLTTCKDCGAEISRKAAVCPKCGAPQVPEFSMRRIVVGVLVALVAIPVGLGVLGYLVFGSGGSRVDGIYSQVARDSVSQYEIAKRGSDPMQTCVQAGMVVAAFLQAKDEPNVHKWQLIEKSDCARAGMSR